MHSQPAKCTPAGTAAHIFSINVTSGLPTEGSAELKAVPGKEGEVWFAGGSAKTGQVYGLWHSSNYGGSYTKLGNVEQADSIGFGKAAPGQTYSALYTVAKIDGVRGIYRSDDVGASWVRINDDQHQYSRPVVITGDPRIYGRVYFGGRGALFGDPVSDQAAPVTTATASPAAPDRSNGWYTSDVTVSLAAKDDISGVAKTEYSLDGGNTWTSYSTPVMFNQDGQYTVSYRSTDYAGNVEVAKTISFKLDSTAPEITVKNLVNGSYNDSQDVTPAITLDESLSGIDASMTTITLDGQAVQHGGTIPLYSLPLGSHTFIVTASDLAGNTSQEVVLFQTTTSIQSMQDLVTRFTKAGWIHNAGIANSLKSKLASNELGAFVNQVKAQSGKLISTEAADYLIRDAQYLMSQSKV